MTASDRAFRALAQAEPDVMMAALRALVPRLAVDVSPVRPEDLSPTRLDALAPAQDVDWVARSGARSVVHLECQGYRDPRFMTRLFRYHLALALLHPRRAVHTVALWLRRPRRSQRARRITRQRITVEVEHVVLGELDAGALLADPRTAWLAAGADAGDMSDEELCARVVAALVDNNASWYQRHMAAVTAQMKKRMKPFEDAMARANLPRGFATDSYLMGFDNGRDEGKAEGLAAGKAEAVLAILKARGLPVSAAQRAKVLACADLAALDAWVARAATAPSTAAVLGDAAAPRKRAR